MANHEFVLIKEEINDVEDVNKFIDRYVEDKDKYTYVNLSDEIISYILDTLKFIKCMYPTGEIHRGIDTYGYSVISSKELLKAKIIFESWKNIFSQGDEKIILRGEYSWSTDEIEGDYELIYINKKDIIKDLENIINILDIAYTENKHVVHLGI